MIAWGLLFDTVTVLNMFLEANRDVFSEVCRAHFHDEHGFDRAMTLMESYRPPPDPPTGVCENLAFLSLFCACQRRWNRIV
jgi:hypothetical protein